MALPLLLAAVREVLKCTVEPFQHRTDARGAALQDLKPSATNQSAQIGKLESCS